MKAGQEGKAPKIGERILRRVLSRLDAESFVGDIQEQYRDLASDKGIIRARVWFWYQILRALCSTLLLRTQWTAVIFRTHLKTTWRNIRLQKTSSVINLTGLAVGMAVCIIIVLWVRYESTYDTFHEHLDDLHRLVLRSEQGNWHDTVMVGLIPPALENEYPEVALASNLGEAEHKLYHRRKAFIGRGLRVNPGFLEMFTFPLLAGDPETALEAPDSIVLTEELAKKLIGDEEALEKTIWVDDQVSLKVTGVVRDIPANSSLRFEFLIPYIRSGSIANHWGWKDVREAYVLLQKGTAAGDVNAKISEYYNERKPAGNSRQSLYLQPMRRVHLFAPGGGGLITYVYIFSVMATVILLIACINFINLSTACSENRFKEIGIRKVVGSTRAQLMRKLLSEYIMLSVLALLIALILVQFLLPSVSTLLGQHLELRLSAPILLIFTGIALLTGLLSGTFPALLLSSYDPVSIIRGRFRLGGKALLRKTLVVTQFALSILFIIGAMVISRQMDYIRQKDLGFQKEQILTVAMRGQFSRRAQVVKERLLALPAVEAASTSTTNMTFWNSSSASGWYDEKGLHEAILGTAWVDHDFLETMKIGLVQGRFYSRDFPTDVSEAYVINQAAARALGLENPVGTRLIRALRSPREDPGIIIGVVADFHTQSLHEEVRPFLLILDSRGVGRDMYLRVSAENIPQTITAVEQTVQKVLPSYPVSVRFLDERIDNLYRHERLTGKIIDIVTALAVFLSCLGLLGLASFMVKKRTKEVGIRKILGSSMPGIASLFLRDFLRWVLLANVFAWPAAWYILHTWLQRFAYRTEIPWHLFLISGSIALLIAGATVYGHSWKAARANPVDSLRHE